MPTDTSEKNLETIIVDSLVSEAGYIQTTSPDYDRDLCLYPQILWQFLQKTQPAAYAKIQQRGGEKFLRRLSDQIRQRGIIDVLRNGVKDLDLHVALYHRLPVSANNPKSIALYDENIFHVTRQLYYSLANNKSLDVVLFLNGLPILTAELKNQWTGQTVKDAIRQYQQDREPREPLFAFGRCVVHFAADADWVFMASELKGPATFFLPFNKGTNDGAGNPLNPNGLKTDYLWKEILTKPLLSTILENYAQVVEERDEDTGKITRKQIFPRYHQLRAVRRLLSHAKAHGAGQRYLIQHSAGSGKSNSIAWLAHQLVALHDASHTQPTFDSVIVVTDRIVLDRQIRDNIRAFAQGRNLVEHISSGSRHLKSALEDGKKIIITTIQKFPHIYEDLSNLPATRFAIIMDEAHSGQSGEAMNRMNQGLAEGAVRYQPTPEEDAPTGEDLINQLIDGRKMLKNASYFAFTATPKPKTLELFGTREADGKSRAFDLYSMKQAIEEGFIEDVLKNYTTYQSFYRLANTIQDNPEYERSQANKMLRRYVEQHLYSIEQKTAVMAGHFHDEVSRRIGGKAKAMVVANGVANAIKYFHAFKKYLAAHNMPYKPIVAFSGKRTYEGLEVEEATLNGFPSIDIPKEFKKPEYRFLIVADKFQTGFDQPLLHTMYVDKPLSGVDAVQTLSRLNRALRPLKEDTFVLDFYNKAEDIQAAFEPYYTQTILSESTDPNKLNDLADFLDGTGVYTHEDVAGFTNLYFNKAPRTRLDPLIDACAAGFRNALSEEQRIDFYVKAKSFIRTYAFLSKILDFNNPYWERLYWFLKFLLPKIAPDGSDDGAADILEAIDLDSYRLTRVATQNLSLGAEEELSPASPLVSAKKPDADFADLANILQRFNDRFGIDNWTDDDKVKHFLFQQLPDSFALDQATVTTIHNSDLQNARITSDKKVEDLMQDVIFTYTDLYKKFTDDKDFKRQYLDFIFDKIWNPQGGSQPPATLI